MVAYVKVNDDIQLIAVRFTQLCLAYKRAFLSFSGVRDPPVSLPIFWPPPFFARMSADRAHDHDDGNSVVTGQKCGPPNALQLGPRKRLSVFRHLILKLVDRFFILIVLLKILLSTMGTIFEGRCMHSAMFRPSSPMVWHTWPMLTKTLLLLRESTII